VDQYRSVRYFISGSWPMAMAVADGVEDVDTIKILKRSLPLRCHIHFCEGNVRLGERLGQHRVLAEQTLKRLTDLFLIPDWKLRTRGTLLVPTRGTFRKGPVGIIYPESYSWRRVRQTVRFVLFSTILTVYRENRKFISPPPLVFLYLSHGAKSIW
jgi:hypothetical protein